MKIYYKENTGIKSPTIDSGEVNNDYFMISDPIPKIQEGKIYQEIYFWYFQSNAEMKLPPQSIRAVAYNFADVPLSSAEPNPFNSLDKAMMDLIVYALEWENMETTSSDFVTLKGAALVAEV